jgi:hypothetical protein
MKDGKGSIPKKTAKEVKRQPGKQPSRAPSQNITFVLDKNRKNQVLIYGGVFFLIESIFAIIFYRERLLVDSSYYFLHSIQSGWFQIDHKRFILAFAEILPLIGSYLGLPLKALLIMYSLNHVFFFLALFLILVLRNDLNGALAITALLAFAAPNLFVNPFLEIWYGAGFAVLLFSLLQKKVFSLKDYIWIALLQITIFFSHPENYILILFLALLDIQKRKKFNRMHLMMLIITIASARYKYLTLDDYEAAKFGGDIHGTHGHHILDILNSENLKNLGVFMLQYYWILLLLLGITCIKYATSGKYLRGGIVFFAFAGTVGLINIADKNYVYTIYGSTMYMPIISIASVPFFYDVFGTMKEKTKNIAFVILFLAVGYRFYNQADVLGVYTERTNQMERIINACDKIGGNKFIINTNNFVKPYSQVNWSFPIETLLLSAERGKDMSRSIATYEDVNPQSKIIFTDSNAFIFTPWDVIDEKNLNQKYFYAGRGVYKELDYKE